MPSVKPVLSVLALLLACHSAAADQPVGAYTTQVCGFSDEPGVRQAMPMLTPGTLIQLSNPSRAHGDPHRPELAAAGRHPRS